MDRWKKMTREQLGKVQELRAEYHDSELKSLTAWVSGKEIKITSTWGALQVYEPEQPPTEPRFVVTGKRANRHQYFGVFRNEEAANAVMHALALDGYDADVEEKLYHVDGDAEWPAVEQQQLADDPAEL